MVYEVPTTRVNTSKSTYTFTSVVLLFNTFPLLIEVPQGLLPILEIDGKVTLVQSLTIARYIARELSK